jgi:hypothetical protein
MAVSGTILIVIEVSVGLPRSSAPEKVIVEAAYTAPPNGNRLDNNTITSNRMAILLIFIMLPPTTSP